MRTLLLGVAALSLSGCSFLGLGGHGHSDYDKNTGWYGQGAAPSDCHSGTCLSRWNLEGGIGPSFTVGGDAVTGSQAAAGSGANIRNIDMEDAFDTGLRLELGGSYAVSPRTKITAMAYNETADSSGTLDWGTINNQRLTGALSDYEASGVELGLRHYFPPQRAVLVKSVRPYIEGRVGAAYVNGIDVENVRLDGARVGTGTASFTDGGWAPSAAGLVGIETPLTRYSTIGLETGIRWTDNTRSETGGLFNRSQPLAGVNNGGERVSVPLMLRGRYRF
ncbi:MAG: hypothetical protein WBF53_13625 [Litorimonas sp.]